ncbi:hypothetical protein N665_0463s0013 [Sinapis alba]|nr:hypothetical protein N665_0463s0013 [Sinapis alba]
MSSPLRRCSSKGKAVATGSDSESSGSPLIRRARTITLRGMDDPRPTTADLALLDDNERDVVRYSLEMEDREATGHAPADDMEQDVELELDRPVTPSADIDSSNRDKNSAEKISFALADFLLMRWTGTNFEFDEEIDLEEERTLSVKKNQNWVNHIPTKSSFKSVRRLIFQTNPPAGFSFLIPAEHQRPWTPPAGYATVYESWFTNCSLWWPLPEFLTMYCNRRKIALGQYTANRIRIMVMQTVLAAELGITMSVRLFEELTTPSITGKTGFFQGKMVPKYNVITGKPSKVNFWNHRYFYVKINEASFEDPSIVFPSGLKMVPSPFSKKLKPSAEEQTEISSQQQGRRMGKLNISSLPSYADTILLFEIFYENIINVYFHSSSELLENIRLTRRCGKLSFGHALLRSMKLMRPSNQ